MVRTPELDKVFEAYGWQPDRLMPIRKGVWRIQEGEQDYALKCSQQSYEKLWVIHHMLTSVRLAGYPHLLPWIVTNTGDPIFSNEEGNWYATPWKGPIQESIPSRSDQIQSLALFHRLAEPIANQNEDLFQVVTKEQLDHWKKAKKRIVEFYENQPNHTLVSPFERRIQERSEEIKKPFVFSIKGLTQYIEKEQGQPPRYTLCHRRLHPSNLCPTEDGWYWIDFDHAEVDSPVRDIAVFLRKVEQAEEQQHLLQIYEQENPLTPLENKLLAVYMAYPERIVRLCHQYDQQPGLATENDSVERLDVELTRYRNTYGFIQYLWKKRKPDA